MPNAILMIPNTGQSVMRPIVIDMVEQLKHLTNISSKVPIFFPDSSNTMSQKGTTLDDVDNRLARLATTKRVQIEVEEDYEPQDVLNTAVAQYEHNPVWYDDKLGVRVSPVYSPTNITINFRYITSSKEDAMLWRNNIRVHMSISRDINVHEIRYHYNLPPAILALIAQVHSNREENYGYGDSLENYTLSHGTPRLRLVGGSDGKSQALSVAERQSRIVGMFDFEGVPEKMTSEESGMWSIGFSYKFSYDKPLAAHMRYPIIIHNQLLPEEFVTYTEHYYDPAKEDKDFRHSLDNMWHFESDRIMERLVPTNTSVIVPSFDDFTLDQYVPYSVTALRLLVTVEKDLHKLFNLRELGDHQIAPSVLRFIEEVEYRYITTPFKSVLGFSLYRDKSLTSGGSLRIDENLDVWSTRPIDPRRQHRVRFYIMTNWDMVDQDAIDRVAKYPDAIVDIVDSIDNLAASEGKGGGGTGGGSFGPGGGGNVGGGGSKWEDLKNCILASVRKHNRSYYQAIKHCLGKIENSGGDWDTSDRWPSDDLIGPDDNLHWPPNYSRNPTKDQQVGHNTVMRIGIMAVKRGDM